MIGFVYALLLVAGLSWLVSAVSAVELAKKHPTEGRSFATYAAQGHLFFSSENFAPSGAAAHRRFMMGLVGFIISGVMAGLLMVVLQAP